MYGPSPAERIAMARRLMARNKLSEALDNLNEAIRHDPRFPDSFETRAEVFEMMGMYPHAQADRRKAADLRATFSPAPAPPLPPETVAPPPPPTPEPEPTVEAETPADPATDEEEPIEEEGEPDAVAEVLEEAGVEEPEPAPEPPPPPPPPTEPAYQPPPEYEPAPVVPAYVGPQRPSVGGAFLRAVAVVLFALGVFIAGGVGIYLALNAVNGDDGTSVAATATPTALDSSTDAATDDPDGDSGTPPTVEEVLRGDPYGFSSVQSAWESAGFTVTVGDISTDVTGYAEDAVDLTITRDGESMDIAILMYDDSSMPGNEWALGSPTTPKGDHVVPNGTSVWYNRNVVVIVYVNEALKPDALEAFLDIS